MTRQKLIEDWDYIRVAISQGHEKLVKEWGDQVVAQLKADGERIAELENLDKWIYMEENQRLRAENQRLREELEDIYEY